eukprot:1153132-Pleurochrysis_carterae.AAC.1
MTRGHAGNDRVWLTDLLVESSAVCQYALHEDSRPPEKCRRKLLASPLRPVSAAAAATIQEHLSTRSPGVVAGMQWL